jgi:hypothetical protein
MSKKEEIRRIREAKAAMKSLRLTKPQDEPFVISMEDGKEVKDIRPVPQNIVPSRGSQIVNPTLPPAQVPLNPVPASTPSPALCTPSKTGLEASPANTDPLLTLMQLQSEGFGVMIEPKGNAFEYTHFVGSKQMFLFAVLASEDGLKEAGTLLKELIDEIMQDLHLRFGINFSTAGRSIVRSNGPNPGVEESWRTRLPKLFELDELAEAITCSDPAHCISEEHQITVDFLERPRKFLPSKQVLLERLDAEEVHLYIFPKPLKQDIGIRRLSHQIISELAQCSLLKLGYRQERMTDLAQEHLRDIALVKPATSSFSSVLEELKEALIAFRSGVTDRMNLLRHHRLLYHEAQRLDQEEINAEYGQQADGSPNKVRLPSGKLVSNKPEMQNEIARFESK